LSTRVVSSLSSSSFSLDDRVLFFFAAAVSLLPWGKNRARSLVANDDDDDVFDGEECIFSKVVRLSLPS
jgi:hypothetical protein